MGLREDDDPLVQPDLDHRICHAWVSACLRGGLHGFATYPQDQIGPTGPNLRLLGSNGLYVSLFVKQVILSHT